MSKNREEHEAEARKGMFCYQCGRYTIKRRELQNSTGHFLCDTCGCQFTKTVLPLFIVTGASGSGKSAIIEPLQRLLTDYGVFDKDEMWARDWDMAYNNQDHAKFAAWLLMNAETEFGYPMPSFETTHKSPQQVAEQVADWIKSH